MTWYVVETKPGRHQEARAESNLDDRGFEVYRPLCQRAERKRKARPEPMFPGYLLVRVRLEQRWLDAEHAPGVKGFLRAGGPQSAPYALPSAIVGDIRRREGMDGIISLAPPKLELVVGSVVRLTNGPFAGHEAELLSVKSEDRVRVLLSLLGGKVEAECGGEDLELLDTRTKVAL